MKTDGHLGGRNLKGREGDAANVILIAVGYNLRRVLAWLRALLRLILLALSRAFAPVPAVTRAS
jgi:transposase, IS5 family